MRSFERNPHPTALTTESGKIGAVPLNALLIEGIMVNEGLASHKLPNSIHLKRAFQHLDLSIYGAGGFAFFGCAV